MTYELGSVGRISDIVVALSAAAVAVVAFFGLQTWRNERKFDVARRVLFTGRRLGEQFRWARNPWTTDSQASDRHRSMDESRKEAEVLDERFARTRRLEALSQDLLAFQEAGWEAEIVLGDDDGSEHVAKAVKAFKGSFGELASSVESYFREMRRQAKNIMGHMNQETIDVLESTIYGGPDDDFSKRIDTIVTELGSALKTHVK